MSNSRDSRANPVVSTSGPKNSNPDTGSLYRNQFWSNEPGGGLLGSIDTCVIIPHRPTIDARNARGVNYHIYTFPATGNESYEDVSAVLEVVSQTLLRDSVRQRPSFQIGTEKWKALSNCPFNDEDLAEWQKTHFDDLVHELQNQQDLQGISVAHSHAIGTFETEAGISEKRLGGHKWAERTLNIDRRDKGSVVEGEADTARSQTLALADHGSGDAQSAPGQGASHRDFAKIFLLPKEQDVTEEMDSETTAEKTVRTRYSMFIVKDNDSGQNQTQASSSEDLLTADHVYETLVRSNEYTSLDSVMNAGPALFSMSGNPWRAKHASDVRQAIENLRTRGIEIPITVVEARTQPYQAARAGSTVIEESKETETIYKYDVVYTSE